MLITSLLINMLHQVGDIALAEMGADLSTPLASTF